MGSGGADEVFLVGAVEVDVALVGVGVFFFSAVEPEDTGEDGVVFLRVGCPDAGGASAFERGEEGGTVADFFTDDELAGGRLVGAFGEADAVGGGGNGGSENGFSVLGEGEELFCDGDVDHAILCHAWLQRAGVIFFGGVLGRVWFLRGHAEFVDEGEVFFDGGVFGGEEFVAVEDGVGSGEKAEGLGFFGELGAAGGEADFGLGDSDAGDGNHTNEVENSDGFISFQWSAGHGHEGVDGNALGLWVEPGDDLDHFEAILDGFAEAEDAAAADGHAGVLDVADGIEAILKGVGGDNVGVVFGGGVDVVVVGGDSGFLEFLGFRFSEFAEGDADFHAHVGDGADDVEDLLEPLGAIAHSAPGGTHAKAGGAAVAGGFGSLDDVAFLHESFGIDTGVVAGGLGAVGAVLRAAAGFDGEEGAELDLGGGPVFFVDGAGFLNEIEKGEVVEVVEFLVSHGWKMEECVD